MNKCERINTFSFSNLMSQSTSDGCNDSSQNPQQQQPQQQQQQQTISDSKINASEIEKLYLKIKEDWL